jgi:hypothetical protein
MEWTSLEDHHIVGVETRSVSVPPTRPPSEIPGPIMEESCLLKFFDPILVLLFVDMVGTATLSRDRCRKNDRWGKACKQGHQRVREMLVQMLRNLETDRHIKGRKAEAMSVLDVEGDNVEPALPKSSQAWLRIFKTHSADTAASKCAEQGSRASSYIDDRRGAERVQHRFKDDQSPAFRCLVDIRVVGVTVDIITVSS